MDTYAEYVHSESDLAFSPHFQLTGKTGQRTRLDDAIRRQRDVQVAGGNHQLSSERQCWEEKRVFRSETLTDGRVLPAGWLHPQPTRPLPSVHQQGLRPPWGSAVTWG